MKKHNKSKRYKKIIVVLVTMLFVSFFVALGLYKTEVYRFDLLKDVYKTIDFKLNTNELSIPRDALSFSVYDIEQGEYLFYEGDSQLPTVASLAKLFVIDYALEKVGLEDIVKVNQEVLDLVPAGSSLANLHTGEYTGLEEKMSLLSFFSEKVVGAYVFETTISIVKFALDGTGYRVTTSMILIANLYRSRRLALYL